MCWRSFPCAQLHRRGPEKSSYTHQMPMDQKLKSDTGRLRNCLGQPGEPAGFYAVGQGPGEPSYLKGQWVSLSSGTHCGGKTLWPLMTSEDARSLLFVCLFAYWFVCLWEGCTLTPSCRWIHHWWASMEKQSGPCHGGPGSKEKGMLDHYWLPPFSYSILPGFPVYGMLPLKFGVGHLHTTPSLVRAGEGWE